MRVFSVIAFLLALAAGYVAANYLRTAWLFYNPPWGDPLFYISLIIAGVAIARGAIHASARERAKAIALVVGGLVVLGECGVAGWFDHRFAAECAALGPNSYAPGCPSAR